MEERTPRESERPVKSLGAEANDMQSQLVNVIIELYYF